MSRINLPATLDVTFTPGEAPSFVGSPDDWEDGTHASIDQIVLRVGPFSFEIDPDDDHYDEVLSLALGSDAEN